jgi:DNA-binding GntR family transcriptional regulator
MFAVRLACERATGDEIRELERFLVETANEPDDVNIERVVYYDQRFHETMARLSGNGEVLRTLKNINSRIYFVRWVAMTGQRATTQKEHREILRAVKARDPERAAARMADHILHRKDQIMAAIREGFSRIYMGELPLPFHGTSADETE